MKITNYKTVDFKKLLEEIKAGWDYTARALEKGYIEIV